MRRAVDFLKTHYSAGLPLKPGGRKTSITLAAFRELRDEGKVRTMLVIAPLRVCRQVWRQEGAKWTQFKDIKFALLHGAKKAEALKSGAEVYLINPEGIAWLAKLYMGRNLPFDIVAIDELTKFQNAQADRHKALRPRIARTQYKWGLTGSLFSKGHMGIFGQQLILDNGAALGPYITHYRDQYFTVGYNGFDYELLPGSERRIIEKLAPYWFYMDETDYAQLPDVVTVPRKAQMDKAQYKIYKAMRDDMVAALPGGVITAANAGACYAKLSQMANGAVYRDGPRGRVTEQLHDLKIEMLEELVDELDGEPLLVGYEFNSDLERIQEWWFKRTGKELPYLGKGTTAKNEDLWVQQWNAGELPILAAHPQSAGHGLNMQEGNACNVAWFSITWDWELFDQFIRRVRRSGNEAVQVFNHLLIISDTIDELKLASVNDKNLTERHLLSALMATISLEEAHGYHPTTKPQESHMVAKLSRPSDAGSDSTRIAGTANGWGTQQDNGGGQRQQDNRGQGGGSVGSGWGAAVGPDPNQDQRSRIQEQVAPQDRTDQARAAFSGGVGAQTREIQNGDYGTMTGGNGGGAASGWGGAQQQDDNRGGNQGGGNAAGGWGSQGGGQQQDNEAPFDGGKDATAATPKRTRTKKQDEAPAGNVDAEYLAILSARATVLAAVIASSPDSSVEELVDVTRDLMDFVLRG